MATQKSLLFYDAIIKLEKIDIRAKKEKKQITIELAKDLDGKIRTDTISIEIVNQLRGKVSERFVHNYLEEKYKQKRQVENARKQKKKQLVVDVEDLSVVSHDIILFLVCVLRVIPITVGKPVACSFLNTTNYY